MWKNPKLTFWPTQRLYLMFPNPKPFCDSAKQLRVLVHVSLSSKSILEQKSAHYFYKGSSSKYFGEGNGNPLQYSCLEIPMDRGAWWATVHGCTELHTTKRSTGRREDKALVTQLCLTLCDPMDCSSPGFSVHRILQIRILEWVPILFSRGSSQPRDQTHVSFNADRFFTI